jgi:hypothetical protein
MSRAVDMYEYWQSPSLGKRARSPVELRQDLQKSRDADAADDLDNLHAQKRYLSEVRRGGPVTVMKARIASPRAGPRARQPSGC